MKKMIFAMVLAAAMIPAIRLAGQMYFSAPCTCRGNPGLKSLLTAGSIDALFRDEVNNVNYEKWSTSQLKAEGKGPKILSEDEDPVGNSAAAYDRWSCQYSAFSAMDKNTKTAWAEGKSDDGIGETVIVMADLSKPVKIWTGVGASDMLFRENNRPRNVRVHLLFADKTSAAQTGMAYVGITRAGTCDAELKDVNGYQPLPLPEFNPQKGNYFIAVEILSVYQGSKYRDTCITEIGN